MVVHVWNGKPIRVRTGQAHTIVVPCVAAELCTEDGTPIPDELCIVTGPNGQTHTKLTDAAGRVRIPMPTGKVTISFPNMDPDAWAFVARAQ